MKTNKIAEIIFLDHRHILRQIRKYRSNLTASNKNPDDYFIPTTYLASNSQQQPAYQVTPLGIDYLARHISKDHAQPLLSYWERVGKSQREAAHTEKAKNEQATLFSIEKVQEKETTRERELMAEIAYLKGKLSAYEMVIELENSFKVGK